MAKELCKRVEENEHTRDTRKYLGKVIPPEHMCGKCGRVAAQEKHLCRPRKISD